MRHFTSDIAVDKKSPSTGLLSFRRFFSLCTKKVEYVISQASMGRCKPPHSSQSSL